MTRAEAIYHLNKCLSINCLFCDKPETCRGYESVKEALDLVIRGYNNEDFLLKQLHAERVENRRLREELRKGNE